MPLNSASTRAAVLPLLALLASCAQPVARVDETSAAPLPADSYADAAKSGAAVYRVDPTESMVVAIVGRDGRLKHLGHDHAIASEDLIGYVEINSMRSGSRADLAMPIRNLVVDKAEYRKEFGLDTSPSESDIAGTYTNMLKVLEPESWPWATVRARFAAESGSAQELAVTIELHGMAFDYLVPVDLEITDERVVVSGEFRVMHTDFGLSPYTAAGGLLRVADEVGIRFRVVARRAAVNTRER